MRKFVVPLLLLVAVVSARAATLDPINIEINPVVQWETVSPPPTGLPYSTKSYLEIPLPQVTLSASDLLTINVHFTDNKMLKVNGSPDKVGLDFVLSNGSSSPANYSNDGLCFINFLNYYDWSPAYTGFIRPQVKGSVHPWAILYSCALANIENGSCFGDFIFKLDMPTYTSLLPIGNPIGIETTTFVNNSIKIYALGGGTGGGWTFPPQSYVPALVVVPEPATLFLLTLGGLTVLRKLKA
jgi:hypothetical protein